MIPDHRFDANSLLTLLLVNPIVQFFFNLINLNSSTLRQILKGRLRSQFEQYSLLNQLD